MENTHDLPYTPGEIKAKLTVYEKKNVRATDPESLDNTVPAEAPAPKAIPALPPKDLRQVLILPLIEDDVLYSPLKRMRTSGASFTPDDRLARIHWPAATEVNQMYITADLRPVITDPKKLKEVK